MKKDGNIVVFISGGLGNQMFEYANARAIQEEYGVSIQFNSCELAYRKSEGRNFGLNNLAIRYDKFCVKNNFCNYIFFKMMRKYLLYKLKDFTEFEKYNFLDKKGMLFSLDTYRYFKHKIDRHIEYVYGNFQSWKYFERYDKMLCEELRVTTPPSLKNQGMLKAINDCNSVCVHIRRGDYINKRQWRQLNICSYNYYYQAMKYIEKEIQQPTFFIFSNNSEDINWIKKNYDLSSFDICYVDLNNPDYEELRLMYSCKHFIISNSTFSWWAQHLSTNSDRIVIAPTIWNRDEEAEDLYEDRWILMDI